MGSSITNITSVTSADGYFTLTGTDASGNPVVETVSFQDYVLLFNSYNMNGMDIAVETMTTNAQYFTDTLREVSEMVSILSVLLTKGADPDTRVVVKDQLTSEQYQTYVKFIAKYTNVVPLGPIESGSGSPYPNPRISDLRSALDNVNEFQTTTSSKSEQWNTRTSGLVSARSTMIDLAKTLLGYIKDALFATVIR